MAVVALDMVLSTSNPGECFLLAENFLRNVDRTEKKQATKFPSLEFGLTLGAGGDSRKVVAVRKTEASSFPVPAELA
jgi:hypothetical protein